MSVIHRGFTYYPTSIENPNLVLEKFWNEEVTHSNMYELNDNILRVFYISSGPVASFKASVLDESEKDSKIVYLALENIAKHNPLDDDIKFFYVDFDLVHYKGYDVTVKVLAVCKEVMLVICDTARPSYC